MAVVLTLMAGTSLAATFDEQRAAMRNTVATQSEAAIIALLESGLAEGKAVPAIAEAQVWLRQNLPEDSMLLYHAGRAAELSGDWKGAVALYRQYLQKADLKTATADDAVFAVYTLLIDRLKDTAGAYSFGRADGGRLLVCPRAKQFDQWFLDEAIKRSDATAVAGRLNACIAGGLPADLLVTRYSQYFRWLLGAVDGYCDHGLPVTQDLYDAVKDLCDVITHDEEMKLRLDWAVSVKAYNVAKIGDKAKAKVVRRPPGKAKGLDGTAGEKQPGNKAFDAKAAAAQAVQEEKLDLGEDATPPIAESAALLEKYPRLVLWVMTGWAGGGNGPHYRGDPKLYWPHEADAKMAPILAALSKLTPDEAAEFLNAAAYGGYVSNPGVLEIRAVRQYVRATPELWKLRNGVVILPQEWNQLSADAAKTSAEKLAQIANPQVSLVRAIAAGGQDYDKVIAALLGPEVWRLGPNELNHAWADSLWHHCGRPVSPLGRDQGIAKLNAVAASFAAGDAKKEDPADKRLATFRNLWADYKSAQPKIPYVRARAVAILNFTPELVPELLKNPDPEVQRMVRDALAGGLEDAKGPVERDGRARGIPHSAYNPWILRLASLHQHMDWMKENRKEFYAPHPLEPALRAAVAERLAQGKIEPWLTMAWINMQFPEDNAEPVKLMQALLKSPAWAGVPTELQFAAREWFRKDAMTPGQSAILDAASTAIVCKDLLSLTNVADVATTAAALRKAIDGVKASPVKINIQGLQQLAGVTNTVFTDPQVFEQLLEVTDGLRYACDHDTEPFGGRMLAHVSTERDPVMLHRTGAFLWSLGMSEHYASSLAQTLTLAQSLLDTQPETAGALARMGLAIVGERPGEHQRGWYNNRGGESALKALYGVAAMRLGLVAIPVAQTHPAYPVYKSQADWLTANEDSAWTMVDENWDQLLPVHRELSVDYLTWLLQRVIYSRDDARLEVLIKALLAWAGEAGTPWTKEQKIDLEIAYGDIALQLGQLENAHKIFVLTQQNAEYADLMARHKATLRRVKVERIAKRFDDALKTVMQLDMERLPEMWTQSRYARAEVYYDMEEFANAADDIDAILAREPDHAEAKILQGRVQLKRQKLMEASELDVGSKNAKNSMVPGENLKVTLVDPTLAVSGAGTEVEVVVWATSGDKETLFLRQFGDQKTKFRGEVKTQLGAPQPGDDFLQVIGDDEIFYAYSDRFREKMNNMEEKRGGPITVRSDAILMASARRLLSEAEQRVADMEAKMAEIARGKQNITAATAAAARAQAAREAADSYRTLEARESAEAGEKARLAQELLLASVKPGKAINVRVIDPDRCRSAAIDEVTVSVESSSGDSVGRITLKETGTHTGWFQGSVPSAGAQAMAFARNTEPGLNPNMVISPTPGYPAWRPTPVAGETPEFKVDLNDNIVLGEMTITAKEPGAKLQRFALQTGMNASEMTTIAVFPNDLTSLENPWHPSVTIMNDTDHHHVRDERSVYDIHELVAHMDQGWMTQAFSAGIAENVTGPSVAMTNSIPGKVQWKRQNYHHNAHVIYRFRGYFYEPAPVTRKFRVELGKFEIPKDLHPSVATPPQFMLAVDGRPITDKAKADLLEGEISLGAGVHRFEIWATGWDCTIGFGRTVKVLANISPDQIQRLATPAAGADAAAPEKLVDVPDSFFDPTAFPKGALSHRNAKAVITSRDDGTTFSVKFAEASRARLLNLVLMGQDGPVPALNSITLTRPNGERILPVAQDYAMLNKNDTLEILTGDKVAVRYVDDRFVNKDNENLERFLNVSFSDAALEFVFFTMVEGRDGEMKPHYEPLLRFKHGEPLHLRVIDADMDMTDGVDTVAVNLESKTGGKKSFTAQETGPSTSMFKLTVIPVPGTANQDDQFQVAAGETISATYRDEENLVPGVPIDRFASVGHAVFAQPALRLSHATVTAIDYDALPPAERPGMRGLTLGFATVEDRLEEMRLLEREAGEGLLAKEREKEASWSGGLIRPRWSIQPSWADASNPPEGGIAAVHGQIFSFEIEAPHLALRAGSQIQVYVQTDAGREQASLLGGSLEGDAGAAPFDIEAPGTMELHAPLAGRGSGYDGVHGPPQIPIYTTGYLGASDGSHPDKHSTRIFAGSVPLIAGFLPEVGVLSDAAIENRRVRKLPIEHKHGLVVRPGEKIHVGIEYTDASGAPKWLTGSAKVITHPVFDVMAEDHRNEKKTAYVGETLYLRVVDLGADVSDASDSVEVLLQAKSGAKHKVELLEADTHSGVFRAPIELSYMQNKAASSNDPPYSVKNDGFPVVYDDKMGARYTDRNEVKTDTALLTIMKGADGTIWPFSKTYDDEAIAMRTQFSLAEAYLEMAKRHRTLGEEEQAKHEYEIAKDMLEKAMDMFRDPDTRAQAEFLLGNLTQEEADVTEDAQLREDRYRAALSRYMRVTGSYPDTLSASKAQFKIATVYERMNEPEIAAQEYVKLAYKYPDSEYLALSMARLGTHFQRKAAEYEKQAKELLAKTEDKDAQFDGKAMEKMTIKEYTKSAEIFARLQERFPDHELAGTGGLRAGQAYMRAGDNREALSAFKRVFEYEAYDGPKLRSQAMYWAGMCYESLGEAMAAYSIYKRLTYDFPESEWASFARSQLSSDKLIVLEEDIEVKRLEEGR